MIFGFTTYGDPDVCSLVEVPAPTPGPGEVLIDLRAAGVNPADIKVRAGSRQGVVEVRFPMAMGREAAGVVLAVGEGVTEFHPGHEVFGATAAGTGGLAERVLLDASATARRPVSLAWEQAACIPVSAGTAFDALHDLRLVPGQVLLVLGAGGGVGTSVIPVAVARGLRVIGVASAAKKGLVEALGAEHVESGDGWVERVRSVAPDGVDALLDMVGGDVLRSGAVLLPPALRCRAAAWRPRPGQHRRPDARGRARGRRGHPPAYDAGLRPGRGVRFVRCSGHPGVGCVPAQPSGRGRGCRRVRPRDRQGRGPPRPRLASLAMDPRELQAHALAKPGAWLDTPWEDSPVVKVASGDRARIFVFLGEDSIGVKAGLDREVADEWLVRYPDGARVMLYLGRSGWNSLSLTGEIPDDELLDAVDESYRLVVMRLPRVHRPLGWEG